MEIMHYSNITQSIFDYRKWSSWLHKPPVRMNMFYLIPFDLNTSAFTQVLLPIHSIGNKDVEASGHIIGSEEFLNWMV